MQRFCGRFIALSCASIRSSPCASLSLNIAGSLERLTRSFSIKAGERKFDDLPHDDVYILDSNLVIAYQNNSIPGWNAWIDAHLKLEKRLYILPQIIPALRDGIPEGFEVLEIEDPKDDEQLNMVYEEIANSLNIHGKLREKAKVDIQPIAYAGYAAASAVHQLSDEEVLAGRVVFASNNFKIIKRILNTREKQDKVDLAIRRMGFEHLNAVRFISKQQTWRDFY
jgi:hypothetical protein